jgi:hypothetical protein
MTGLPLFDAAASSAAKEEGMNLAANSRKEILRKTRAALVGIALNRDDRCVTADDAQRWLEDNGYGVGALGNAAGSLFRGDDWEFTGRWIKSARVISHANDLRVWRLV